MDLLLDTHILLWMINGDDRMPAKAKDLILDLNNTIYFSSISIMEIAIKHKKNPDIMPLTGDFVYRTLLENGIYTMPLKAKHISALENLKIKDNAIVNGDPFDRALIAQAKYERMKLVTTDSAMEYYDEDCLLLV